MNEEMFSDKENDFVDETEEEESALVELPHIFKLEVPIETSNGSIESVTISKRPTAQLMKHLPIGDIKSLRMGHYIPIVSGMTGTAKAIIEKIDAADFIRLITIIAPFCSNGPTAGKRKED